MCNAHNHPPGCTCGFGGEGHLGRRWGSYTTYSTRICTSWQYRDEDFCQPTTCPYCGAKVYFVRHNGGSVWLDKLGQPWPKHECFDNDGYTISLQQSLTEQLRVSSAPVFGIIIETELITPGIKNRIVIRCSDGSIIDREFRTRQDQASVAGTLVLVNRKEDGRISLQYVNPV